jgi:Uma2 family endonuclease
MGADAMVTTIPDRLAPFAEDQCVEWHGLDWKGYVTMLRLRGERPIPRMIYLDGSLFLVTTSFPHERLAERLGIFVIEVVVGLDIPCVPAGGTTFRRRKKRGGVEGDKTFYLANEARVRGKEKIDLRTDPPPDLAIEAVYTHAAAAAVEVYRRLGVSEVWLCDEEGLHILVLRANGRYAESEASAAFPFLTEGEIFSWVGRPQSVSETEWVKEVRRWVRETLAPRRAGPQL